MYDYERNLQNAAKCLYRTTMCSDKRQQTDFGDSYDAAELRFLDLICSLAKVSIQGYDKHRNVIDRKSVV